MSLNASLKERIDRAIRDGAEPFAPARSRGLVLRAPGESKSIQLVRKGAPSAAGQYYYQQIRKDPPDRGFDSAEPVRVGRKEIAMLKSGQKVTLRTFDGK